MQTTFKLVFNRKKKTRADGKALVQLYTYRDKTTKFFSTGIYVKPEHWKDKKPYFVHNDAPNSYIINKLLSNMLSSLEKKEFEQIALGENITDEQIIAIIRGKETNDNSFIDFMIKTIEERNDITYSTKKQALSVVNKLKDNNIINFSDLTVENLETLQNNLLKTLKPTRAHKIHSITKAYINIAIRRNLMKYDDNPYLKLTIQRGKSEERKYLTPEELKKIENKNFEIERLQMVKDLFLFSCYTGLSYTDTQSLTKDNIIKEDNTEFIRTFRGKTKEKAIIYLFSKAKDILIKYNYTLPKLSNQRLNSYLKEIADISGVKKQLTFHMARHTFATTVLLLNNVNISVVSKALGHTDIKTTQLYAKVVDKLVADQMKGVEDKL